VQNYRQSEEVTNDYWIAVFQMTLSDLQGHSHIASLSKCYFSYSCGVNVARGDDSLACWLSDSDPLVEFSSLPHSDAFFLERCSDRGKNQRHSWSVLPTTTSSTRVWERGSRHLDFDETMLGRGTIWKTYIWWNHQDSQVHQQWKVSIIYRQPYSS